MTCRQFQEDVERLVKGDLPPEKEQVLRAHASTCDACSALWAAESRLQQGIVAQSIPEPAPDFETRIRNMALSGKPRSVHRRNMIPVWGSAVAAVLALGIFIGLQLQPERNGQTSQDMAQTSAQEVIAEPRQRTVRLAFNSRKAMEGVTLTLELPANVELAPFPGRQNVSWKVNLKEGDNVLALPLNVLFPGSGELVAHLDDGRKRKTFSTAIPDTEPSS